MLRRLIPPNDSHLLYVEHLEEGDGRRFFELVCEQDLEGIICKPKTSPYPFTSIKVKNPSYSQAAGNGLIVCCPNDKNHHCRASFAYFFRSLHKQASIKPCRPAAKPATAEI